MKTVTGRVISSKPISLSKAASTLSSFLSTDNGASPAFCAYLRRASASFNELKQLHKELRSSRSDRKHGRHRSEAFSDFEAAVDKPHRIGDGERKNSSVSESKGGKRREISDRTEEKLVVDVQSGRESGREYREDVVGVDGKRSGGELKTEIEDKLSKSVEKDVESNDRVKNRKKKHKKKKSEEEHDNVGDDEREAEARQSYSKSGISDNNGEVEAAGNLVANNGTKVKDRKKHEDKNNDDGKDLLELPIKKKKKKKQEDAGDLQNSGGAMEKEEMPVSDNKELRRKEKKKRKNRDIEEAGDDGSAELHSSKRRKGNL